MPWIARLTVIKQKGSGTGYGVHRRGEVIQIEAVDALPDPAWVYKNSRFVYVYIRDIPDARTIEQFRAKLFQQHSHSTLMYPDADPGDPSPYIDLARKKRFIPVSLIPNAHKIRLRDQGWTDFGWNAVKNALLKRRQDDAEPNDADEDADDAAAISDSLEA